MFSYRVKIILFTSIAILTFYKTETELNLKYICVRIIDSEVHINQ